MAQKLTVVTPFQRKENIELMARVLKDKADWTVLIDNENLKDKFPEWVTVKLYEKQSPRAGVCISNSLFNQFILQGLEDDIQYMILCDDDSVEEGFFDKVPNDDAVIVSMKRGQRVPMVNCTYGWGDLIAHSSHVRIGRVAGEQCILKGKILRDYRYGLSACGDGEMVVRVQEDGIPITYVPDAFVLFNYFEDGRYDSFRRKPIVLFVGDYYCAGLQHMGLSEWEGNIWASLESTRSADIARFHFDKYYYHYGKRGDEALLKAIESIKPDYVVLIIYKEPASDPTVIALETIKAIKEVHHVPIISIWGDLEASEQVTLCQSLSPYMWKIIGTASKEVVEGLGYIYMHVPKDHRVFHTYGWKNDNERPIDIVFSGSFGRGREERRAVLNYLVDHDVKLLFGGSEGADHFTTEEYARRYKDTKMALSFSQARGKNVVNARPF